MSMWNQLAAGFAEFATVVKQDAQTIAKKIEDQAHQLQLNSLPAASPTASSSPSGSRQSFSPSSPGTLSAVDFTLDIPRGGCIAEDSVRNLQSRSATYLEPIDDEQSELYTPSFLRADSTDDAQRVEQKAFELGEMLLRNSNAVLEQFRRMYPEANRHNLESLQNAVIEANDNAENNEQRRVLPSAFFIRYFVRLNMLAVTSYEQQQQHQQDRNRNHNNRRSAGDDDDDNNDNNVNAAAAVLRLETRVSQLERENERLHNELAAQRETHQDFERVIKIKQQALTEAQMRIAELEEKLKLQSTALSAAGVAGVGHTTQVSGSDSAVAISSPTSSHGGVAASAASAATPAISSPNSGARLAAPPAAPAAAPRSSASSSAVKVDEEEDEEGWTDIA